MKIGVLDSGIGGLTILKKLIKECPYHEYIYYGDIANQPYGNKNREELLDCFKQILLFFEKQKIDLIVVACGTLSSIKHAINCSIPLIDVLSPIKGRLDSYESVAVLATPTSIKKNKFKDYIKGSLVLLPASKLAMAIENDTVTTKLLESYIPPHLNVDALLLGCTHYPLAIDLIKKIYHGDIVCLEEFIVDEINKLPKGDFDIRLVFSDISPNLEKRVQKILEDDNLNIERVS